MTYLLISTIGSTRNLLNSIAAEAEVILLDSTENIRERITEILGNYSNLSNIHFVLPERDGDRSNTELDRLTEKGLEIDRDRLSSWLQGQSLLGLRQSFAEDATIFFHEFNPQTKTFETLQELAIADSLEALEARHNSLKSEELNNSLNTRLALENSNEQEHGMVTTDLDDNLSITSQILFIDSQVEDYQTLATGVIPGTEVVILDADKDSIKQISAVLSQRPQVASIHIVSHGSPGCLYLGNSQLNLDNLEQYASELQSWFSPSILSVRSKAQRSEGASSDLPSQSPSLLLYGCNVAAGDAGAEFITKLHRITGAEISASATRTGNAALGGDWNLEYRTAKITAETAFTQQTQDSYTGVLNYILVDNKTTGTINNATTTANPLVKTFTVTDNVTVNNLTLGLNVTHARRGDLLFTLTSPDNTTVTVLANNTLDLNTNFDLLLQDGSANAINDGNTDTTVAPVYSADRIAAPTNPFSAFNGKSAQGIWTLRIADTVPATSNGTFNSARLTLNLPPTLNFQNPTLVSGTNLAAGSVYRFSNIATGVDALVTVAALNGGATLASIDTYTSPNGTAQAFQPTVNVPANAANASVDFTFAFVNTGTNTPTTVSNFLLSPIDVDSDGGTIREYVDLSNISSYTVDTPTNITSTYNSATEVTRFQAANSTNVAGISASATANIATAQYGTVTGFKYTAGALTNGATAQTRLFSLDANGTIVDNYTAPVITTVNNTPVLDLDANNSTTTGFNYQTSYTENNAGVSIGDTDTTITDDDANIESATITLTNAQANDLLAAGTLPTGITASAYNSTTGVITLTGSATLANYQTAIQAITFRSTSDNPSTTPRTVNVVVNDGETNSNTATTTINVTAVNDPPVIDLDGNNSSGAATGANYLTTFSENGTAVAIADTDISITDLDNANITSATITLTNAQASDLLAAGTIPTGITASAYNSATGVITLSGSATLADYQTAIQAITFNNTSDNPSTTPRTVNVVVNDSSANSNTATTTINVTAVNDPPIIDLNGGDAGINYSTTFSENGGAVNVANLTIADVADAENNITSLSMVVGGSTTDAATETVNLGGQSFALNANGTTTASVGGTTLNLAYTAATRTFSITNNAGATTAINQADLDILLRGITYNNSSENPTSGDRTFSFTATDANGASTASPAVSTITVNPVNDPPVLDLDSNNSSGATGANYQNQFNFNSSSVAIADSDTTITDLDNTNITSATITLTNRPNLINESLSVLGTLPTGITASVYNPATGVITLSGSATLANYQTAIAQVAYDNTATTLKDYSDRSISVVVSDGIANSNTATTTIKVNDPPVIDLDGNNSSTATGANYQTTFTENGTAVSIGDVDTTITDGNNSNITSAAIALTNPLTGDRLLVGGTAVAIGNSGTINGINYNVTAGTGGQIAIALSGSATLANYQDTIRAITFDNTSDNPSTTPRTVNVTVNDGTVNSNTATTTINVTPVNDPPVIDLNGGDAGINYSTTFTENGTAVKIADGLTADIADAENNITSLSMVVGGSTTDAATETVNLGGQSFALNANGTTTASVGGTTLNLAYTAATRTFSITNNAGATTPIAQADLDTLLQSITYNNSSENPTSGDRTFSFTATDAAGANTALPAVSTITVAAVNDPPVIDLDTNDNSGATGNNYRTTFTENGTAVSIADTDISISDLDNSNIASATITLTNAQASDLLAAGTLPGGITASAYNSATGVITLSGSATLANYQTAIQAITFNNTSDNPDPSDRTIEVVVNDGNNNSNTAISTINVIPVFEGTESSETLTGSFGNDVMIGDKGQDTLTGAGGNDRFYYNETSEGIDIITDFDPNGDLLDFRGIIDGELSSVTFTANPFDDGYVEAVSFGSHTMIQVDFNPTDNLYNKDVVLLKDVTTSTISASDFIFS